MRQSPKERVILQAANRLLHNDAYQSIRLQTSRFDAEFAGDNVIADENRRNGTHYKHR